MSSHVPDSIHEACGALHLHTRYSDGAATCEELIATARQLCLDYVIVTDHMSLGALVDGHQGFHGPLLVSVGYEHNDAGNRNHYLAMGVDRVAGADAHPQAYIDAVRSAGGIGFLAHPCEKRHYFAHLPPYPWTAWDAEGYDGIEIWNQMSDWVENLKSYFSAIRFLYPRRYIFGTSAEVLARWDEANRRRFVAGIGGVDAHARRVTWGPLRLTVFPLKVELQAVRTHVYLDAPLAGQPFAAAHAALLSALRDGRGFVANFRWGDARGARFHVEDASGRALLPGRQDKVPMLPAVLRVRLPLPARVCLLKNGRPVDVAQGARADFTVNSRGVYRVEVYRQNRAWIYTNPFPLGEYPF